VRQPPGALSFFWQANPQFHRGLLSAAPLALGQAGFESHANGRKMFEPVSSTMGGQWDSKPSILTLRLVPFRKFILQNLAKRLIA
jgi:hypothetical protein